MLVREELESKKFIAGRPQATRLRHLFHSVFDCSGRTQPMTQRRSLRSPQAPRSLPLTNFAIPTLRRCSLQSFSRIELVKGTVLLTMRRISVLLSDGICYRYVDHRRWPTSAGAANQRESRRRCLSSQTCSRNRSNVIAYKARHRYSGFTQRILTFDCNHNRPPQLVPVSLDTPWSL